MRTPAAILSGVATTVVIAILLSLMSAGIHGAVAWCALLSGLVMAAWVFQKVPPTPGRHLSMWDWSMILFFACASARAFLWLLYADGDSWKVLSPNNLGDLSLHLAFIHHLSATAHWWPHSPILEGDPLRYPLGGDLFNALLLHAGVRPEISLLWCGIVGATLAGYALWRWGGAVALAALLFNGGLAGVMLLRGKDPDTVSEWKNLFLTLFVTQRGFLFALPAGLLLLATWREESFGKTGKPFNVILPLPVQGILLGTIPLFSIHAALFLGVAMTGLALIAPASRPRMLKLAVFAWPPMALFGWLVSSGAGGPSAVHALGWAPGWMGDGTIGFWFWNFGITLPLCLVLILILVKRDRDAEARGFVWPAAFVFVLCMIIRFAPWPWDNMKLMLWSWIVVAPYLWSVLLCSRPFWVRLPVLVFLFGSGAATLLAGLDGHHGYELIKRSALDQTEWILREAAPDALIAIAPEYNHPVLILGHPVVCGYEGHLWSHGLDYKGRLALLNSIMMGESGWHEKARSLGVSYIYWSSLEAKRWPASHLPWAKETSPSLHRVE
jgi:hypothetical protein